MSKLGYFLGGVITGALGLAGANMLHERLTGRSDSYSEAEIPEAADVNEQTVTDNATADQPV